MKLYVAVDLGGTKIIVASYFKNNKLYKKTQNLTPYEFEDGINLVNKMIEEVLNGHELVSIGCSIGGPIDYKNKTVSPVHQPKWRQIPLEQIMKKRWNVEFKCDVDTNAAALAEYNFGKYNEEYFLYITLSTGMGGGFLINGEIYKGKSHPEIAHQEIIFAGNQNKEIKCKCGASNCLEMFVSGSGIEQFYGKKAENLSEKEKEKVAFILSKGLRNIVTILSPDVIVFGGGVAIGYGDNFLEIVKKNMQQQLKIVQLPELLISKLNYETALMGALMLAKQVFKETK